MIKITLKDMAFALSIQAEVEELDMDAEFLYNPEEEFNY